MRSKQRSIIKSRLSPPVPDLTRKERKLAMLAAFNEAAMNAWFATALEQTKSVFTLASAGVGLTITLAFSDGAGEYPCSFAPVWLVLSGVLFAISAGFCVFVFRANTKIVMLIVDAPDIGEEEQDRREADYKSASAYVGRLDQAARVSFGAALVLSLFAVISKVWGL
jgi:hypothetical protein